jgi:pimeloyl-ACP methyl ester carboxylesterase
VVILHGLFGISDNWVTFGRRLGEESSVFIPDLRNHGQSPHSNLFDYPSMVEDIYEFTEEQGLDEFVLMGHSLGGKIAMEFASLYPEKVLKLIVVDISLRRYSGDRDHQRLINAMLQVDFARAASRSDVERQLAETVKSTKIRQFLLKNVYWRDKSTMGWRLNLAAINDNLPLIFDSVGKGNPFMRPALFIRGEDSDYILGEDEPLIHQQFPASAIKTISGASHWVHADAPEAFYKVVETFLAI